MFDFHRGLLHIFTIYDKLHQGTKNIKDKNPSCATPILDKFLLTIQMSTFKKA